MTELEQIEQAIIVLEANRALVGDEVFDTTIVTLQEKLESLKNSQENRLSNRTAQRKQITTLFASVSGLASIADFRNDTHILDVMKVLWRHLDGAITEHGGVIDKHVGDGVMGLFGVPVTREDDPERAIRAALTIRAALSNFIAEMDLFDSPSLEAWRQRSGIEDVHPFRNLQIHIGINTGPVLLGKVGTGDEYTVIGSAVNVASRMKQAAPPGGILISHDTYLLVRGIFNVEPLGPVTIKGKSEPIPVYLVLGVNPRTFFPSGQGVEGIRTQMVGRNNELLKLQKSLRTAIQTNVGQVITIRGEAGVGKSRLVHEFVKWVGSLSEEIMVFKGRTDQRMSQQPYSLIRDLLASHFGIQDTDQATVVEDKLARGMHEYLDQSQIDVHSRARVIGQLIGLSVSGQTQTSAISAETPQVRARLFNYIADYIESAAAKFPATLMILEDIHWADEKSLDLVNHLALVCRRVPLLLICLARPQSVVQQASRQTSTVGTNTTLRPVSHVIDLSTLSENESRLLVKDILRKVPEIPEDLCGLIVTKADGNPFYMEELIKVLIEDGVIVTGQKQWHVQQNQDSALRMPPTLTGVLQARLDRLSSLERTTLQRAAVVGRVFWSSSVVYMGEMDDRPLHAMETTVALQALEKRELIFRLQISAFAGTEAYFFKHAILRDVTYESVLLRKRPVYHKLVADWLTDQSGQRIAEYAGIVAEHYEQAGEQVPAAEMYETAGTRAQRMYNPDVAIGYYRKALSLITDEPHHAEWQVRVQEQLGGLLRLQARLVEAAQTYMTMQYIANADGHLDSQAHAWLGLALIYREQTDYRNMLDCANRAEQATRLVGANEQLIQALLHQGTAHFRLGNIEFALAAAKQALELSERVDVVEETAMSLSLLCTIHLETGNRSDFDDCLQRLEAQTLIAEKSGHSLKLTAIHRSLLGRALRKAGQNDQATLYVMGALKLYRELDHQQEIADTLNVLGELSLLRGDSAGAIPLLEEAISTASAIGDKYSQMFYRTNLGAALIRQSKYETAVGELRRVIRFSKNAARVSNWVGYARACAFTAEAYLGQGDVTKALPMALEAHSQAKQTKDPLQLGVSWRVLGLVSTKLPPEELPIIVDELPYDSTACFEESIRVLRTANGDISRVSWEQAQTLNIWADSEERSGDPQLGNELRDECRLLMKQREIAYLD